MIEYVPFNVFNADHKAYYDSLRVTTVSDLKATIAVLDGKIVGMVLLDSWTDNSCQAHIRMDNPMCLRPGGLIHRAVQYVYDFNGREIIFGLLRSDNQKAIEFDKRLGFKEVAVLPDAYAVGVDSVILAMRKEDCVFYTPHLRAA